MHLHSPIALPLSALAFPEAGATAFRSYEGGAGPKIVKAHGVPIAR
jgi:hypothetical protein